MLAKPDLPDEKIVACLESEYRFRCAHITFLPLGADVNTAVYRVVSGGEFLYFMKLRRGPFDELSVALPRFLRDQGIPHIMAPLPTMAGRLTAALDSFRLVLYRYVEGRDGYQVSLSERQWGELGAVLRRIHAVELPPGLLRLIRRERYSSQWRDMVKAFPDRVAAGLDEDPLTTELAAFLMAKRQVILDLLRRAECLAEDLKAQPRQSVLCHSDLHAGNLLITDDETFYIVDWDEPILAPKERDLMFPGAALMGQWRTPQEEEAFFYQGYGPTEIDATALAYYRTERIIEDIGVECESITSAKDSVQDRAQMLRWLKSNFLPGNTIDLSQADPFHSAP